MRERGLASLCWPSRLHGKAPGPFYWLLPQFTEKLLVRRTQRASPVGRIG
eukprot:COSAG01_NODE_7181_length_3317_cov_1.677129_4_plen_50_part_00